MYYKLFDCCKRLCSATAGDNSGLVQMLWVGALVPLGQAVVVWRWRFSVRDEIDSSALHPHDEGSAIAPTHVVIADYTPTFERALAASKDDRVTRVPQSNETSEVRARLRLGKVCVQSHTGCVLRITALFGAVDESSTRDNDRSGAWLDADSVPPPTTADADGHNKAMMLR